MLTINQITDFSKQLKITQSVVVREYIQSLFLKELYEEKFSENIFFKGGTAIRLVLGGTRFSEDLDFTVIGEESDFNQFILPFFTKLEKQYGFTFKKRKSVAGQKYLLTDNSSLIKGGVFISLDFSFREAVLRQSKSVVSSIYPVIFTSFVYHLAAEEILAEKVRAILTRQQGRDIYDLWYLLSQNTQLDTHLVKEKLNYYQIDQFSSDDILVRIELMSKEQFIIDLRPFVPISEREKLGELFEFVVAFLRQKLQSDFN